MDPIACHPDVDEPTSAPITVIISSLAGETIAFPVCKHSNISSIYDQLASRTPWLLSDRILLTTNSRRNLLSRGDSPIASLLASDNDTFLPLRLTIPLCGGKGGFGSQLRAQGGRMASRKKRNQQDSNSSSRNLEGRRIRTVNEAKVLAEYLAIKPEMDKKEREERRQRWQDIVDMTERRERDIRTGKNVRLDGKFIEDKEEAEEKTRQAILKSLEEAESPKEGSPGESSAVQPSAAPKAFFGWDDEDGEFMSDSNEEEEVSEEDADKVGYEGKGKGKAV